MGTNIHVALEKLVFGQNFTFIHLFKTLMIVIPLKNNYHGRKESLVYESTWKYCQMLESLNKDKNLI